MTWLRRNTMPIVWVLVASAVVIGLFEVVDAFVGSGVAGEVVETEEPPAFAGIIKVTLFIAIPFAITLAVRRRQE